jgi:hypothetical protein
MQSKTEIPSNQIVGAPTDRVKAMLDHSARSFIHGYHSDSGVQIPIQSLHGALQPDGSPFNVCSASLDARWFAGRRDVLGPIRRRCDSFPVSCSTRKSTALGQAQTPDLNYPNPWLPQSTKILSDIEYTRQRTGSSRQFGIVIGFLAGSK